MTARHDPLVRVSQLSKSFSGVPALRSVNLDIRPGERVALLGASGSGKSTLLRCLCGLETADRGDSRVQVFGQVLQAEGRLGPDIRALRRDIGIVFQQFNLVGRLPVMSNVLAGLSAELPLWRSLLGRFTLQERARAMDALEAVGLAPQAFQRASTLSGGQQQRAAIARVLVQGARLLLADEPVASLDPESTRRVMEQLSALASADGMTLVVSLHHVELARLYCNRVVALRQGQLVFDGPTSALTPEFLQLLYGTQAEELLQDLPIAQEHLPVAAAVAPPRQAPQRPPRPARSLPAPRSWPWSGLGNGTPFTLF